MTETEPAEVQELVKRIADLLVHLAALKADRDRLDRENALLRKALERFLETTEGEDAVSGMALHGPITLAKAALAH